MLELVYHIVRNVVKNRKQSIDQIIDNIMSLEEGTKIQVLAPIVRGRKVNIQNSYKSSKNKDLYVLG